MPQCTPIQHNKKIKLNLKNSRCVPLLCYNMKNYNWKKPKMLEVFFNSSKALIELKTQDN
jgi:hypothetical protein